MKKIMINVDSDEENKDNILESFNCNEDFEFKNLNKRDTYNLLNAIRLLHSFPQNFSFYFLYTSFGSSNLLNSYLDFSNFLSS